MDDDYFLEHLQRWKRRFKGAKKAKNHIILGFSILVLGAGLFFYFFAESPAYSATISRNVKINPEVIDPLSKIGKGLLSDYDGKGIYCAEKKIFIEKSNGRPEKIEALLAGYPMTEMVPYIAKRNPKVASFLVSIAKKESDWGKHSPQKDGKTCYNYWGYRGGYNPTDSGYSCFDSAEQAVQVVGDRIKELTEENINTPERMVVWKCGSTCGQDQDAQNWISTVAYYFGKLNS